MEAFKKYGAPKAIDWVWSFSGLKLWNWNWHRGVVPTLGAHKICGFGQLLSCSAHTDLNLLKVQRLLLMWNYFVPSHVWLIRGKESRAMSASPEELSSFKRKRSLGYYYSRKCYPWYLSFLCRPFSVWNVKENHRSSVLARFRPPTFSGFSFIALCKCPEYLEKQLEFSSFASTPRGRKVIGYLERAFLCWINNKQVNRIFPFLF